MFEWLREQFRYQGKGHQRRAAKRMAKRDRERYAPGRPVEVVEKQPADTRR